nr:hypothetical protein CFP56_52825 [Quercus suber]
MSNTNISVQWLLPYLLTLLLISKAQNGDLPVSIVWAVGRTATKMVNLWLVVLKRVRVPIRAYASSCDWISEDYQAPVEGACTGDRLGSPPSNFWDFFNSLLAPCFERVTADLMLAGGMSHDIFQLSELICSKASSFFIIALASQAGHWRRLFCTRLLMNSMLVRVAPVDEPLTHL